MEIFQGDFWNIEWQKRNGIEEGKQYGWWGRSNALGSRFGVELKVVEVDSKERNGRNDKKKLKNYVFSFRTVMRNGPESNFGCSSKGKLKTDFAWPCKNFAQSYEML